MSATRTLARLVGTMFILWGVTAFAVQPLEITSVNVNYETSEIFIYGVNFDNGGDLEINLSDIGQIASFSVTPTLIVASFPVAVLPAGNYLLTITSGGGLVRHDEMPITVGMDGPDGPQGDQGPQGLQGIQGPAGEQGVRGEPGLIGPMGATGPQGPTGDAGAQGLKGDTGLQGLTGDKGDKGDTGSQGLQGLTGDTGSQGVQGVPGPQGSQGLKGDPGVNGADGADGAQGGKGDTGPQGLQGIQGFKGDPGLPGANGADGSPGPQGPAGADGTDGAPGADGLPGADGALGPQGVAGNLALAGQSCPTGSFVTGFNSLGEIICNANEPGPGDPPVSLPNIAEPFAISINGLIGNELGLPNAITAVAAGATVSWLPTLSGFALCLPSNLDAPPAATSPIYGCLANATVNVLEAADGSDIEITVRVADLFYDFAGDWTLQYVTNESGSGAGYVLLGDVVVTVNASLIDAGGGFWQIGPTNWAVFSYGSDSYEIDFGNPLLDLYSFVVGDSLAVNLIGEVEKTVVDTIEQQALSMPPFLIE